MKQSVAVIGADGKMGARAAENIGFSDAHNVLLCESNADRAQVLEDRDGDRIRIREVAILRRRATGDRVGHEQVHQSRVALHV